MILSFENFCYYLESRKVPKDKDTKLPKKYLTGFNKDDKDKRAKEIKKRSDAAKKGKYIEIDSDKEARKKNKGKESQYTKSYKKKYGEENSGSIDKISKATGISKSILNQVLKRGKGAFFSSGSRPGQTAHSWGMARVYSFVMGGKTQKTADADLWKKAK